MSGIYDPQYKVLIDCLKTCRLNSRMTQQELASLLNCGQSLISKYEQGQKRLDIVETRHICNALGLSLSEFVNYYESILKKEGL